MSPELQNYYKTKQRRKAFYIVENEGVNKENPPEISAIIGLDKELEAFYYADRKKQLEKPPAIDAGMRINRNIHSNKKNNEKKPVQSLRKNEIHCPNLPTQWRSTFNVVIPKAEFGYFAPTRKKVVK